MNLYQPITGTPHAADKPVAPIKSTSRIARTRSMDKPETLHKTGSRMQGVNPFRVMEVLNRAAELEREGRRIVHMGAGEPDFTTAEPIREAAKRALDAGLTQYTQAPGIPELRDALVELYRERHGLELPRERILITLGASGGLAILSHLLLQAGAGVLLTDPSYPCYRNLVRLAGAEPQLMPVGVEDDFLPSIALLEKHRRKHTAGLWLASPGNPTGAVIGREHLQAISDWADAAGAHLLLDETYHGLHYTADMPSVLELNPRAFVVNSFSKYFGMTGWRLGWIVVPEAQVEAANILAQNLFISPSSFAQYAALAAFTPAAREVFEQRRAAFRERRDYLAAELTGLGMVLPREIQGAFYAYANISAFSRDSEAFCRDMLENHGVAITPGTDFGEINGNEYVRMAFTTGMEDLRLGVERLRRALG